MKARLFAPVGRLKVNHEFSDNATLGRSPENSLVLESALLSSYHVRISWDQEIACYRLQDMGSTNGTRLDGARVTTSLPLGHLHVITLADRFDFVFQDLERCAARHSEAAESQNPDAAGTGAPIVSEKTSIGALSLALPDLLRGAAAPPPASEVSEGTLLERLPISLPGFLRRQPAEEESEQASASKPDLPTASQPDDPNPVPATPERFRQPSPALPTADLPPKVSWQDVRSGSRPLPKPPPGPEHVDIFFLSADGPKGLLHFPLRDGRNQVGRGHDCEVRIESPEVSRHHALLTLGGGRLRIRDLGSRNKTYVDDKVIGAEEVDLLPGQRLRFGRLEVKLDVRTSGPGSGKEGKS